LGQVNSFLRAGKVCLRANKFRLRASKFLLAASKDLLAAATRLLSLRQKLANPRKESTWGKKSFFSEQIQFNLGADSAELAVKLVRLCGKFRFTCGSKII
jgi:hypothetical protein